jgi:hypothetical protein
MAAAKKKTAKVARAIYEAENVNHPGTTHRVDAAKYKLVREAMLKLLPKKAPGMTQSDMAAAMRKALSRADFPGTTSSWWMKTVQLDLEAKGIVVRDKTKPLTWRKA